MSKVKGLAGKYFNVILWIAAFAVVIYLVARNINTFGNLLLTLIGFGAVVLVHEFGHFIFAKLTGIKVEAFSIGFPPVLAGILRVEKGWRIRILPSLFAKGEESGEGGLSFTIGKKVHQPGETEYRIGVIPFGGFVKMLGQEDIGAVETSDDPRSFANKTVGARMAVIAAGVVFNAISALIVFMTVFLIGINRVPAVVGGVTANSPAARAGLRGGDEVIEVAGKSKDLDYYDVAVAAALSGRDEKVALKVRHEEGGVENYSLTAERGPGDEVKGFGVEMPHSLAVAEVSDANKLLAKTGLLPGDRVISVDGKDVRTHWELEKVVEDALVPEVTILAERSDKSGKVELIESNIPLDLSFENREPKSESDLAHIYSMVPRLLVKAADTKIDLRSGDIILAVGDVENPAYKEIHDVTTEYEAKELPIRVLRADANGVEESFVVTVVPKRSQDGKRVVIGIFLVFDAEHPVVAKTIAVEGGPAKLDIPRGAVIRSVGGVSVSNFYEIIREIRRNAGKRVRIDYRLDEKRGGSVVLDLKTEGDFVTVESVFADFVIPFELLERLYKAAGPINAIGMGYRKTVMFIAQAYITLKGLVTGLFSLKSLMGPVGILSLSYRIVVERPLIDYVYFLGLISAFLAVFNVLPLLPFDGGHILFLLIEKIKGSPVGVRVQEKAAFVGWVLVMALVLYVTFNDVVGSFFG
jgi:regulator of sigma E protease